MILGGYAVLALAAQMNSQGIPPGLARASAIAVQMEKANEQDLKQRKRNALNATARAALQLRDRRK